MKQSKPIIILILFVLIYMVPILAQETLQEIPAAAPGVEEQIQKVQKTKAPKKLSKEAPKTHVPEAQEPEQINPEPIAQEPIIKTQKVSGKNQITLSATLPLTGAGSIIGQQLFDGMNLYFNKIKTEKNIPFSIKLNSQNNKWDSARAVKNATELMKESEIFLSLTGTDTITMLQKEPSTKKILGLFPVEGIETLRGESYKNLIYYRPVHKKELRALVHYTITKLNKKKIAIFYESGDWGEGVLGELQDVLKEFNVELIAQASYPQNTVNITKAINTLAQSAPNAIFCVAQARPAYHFIREILNKGLHNTVFFGLSNLFSIQKTLRKSRGVDIMLSSVVPDPVLSNLPIAKEYRADMQKYLPNKNITPFSFEGYINAALACEFMKKAQLPMTQKKLLTLIENTKDFNFKGLALHFDKVTKTLSHNIWINTGKKKKEWSLAKTR